MKTGGTKANRTQVVVLGGLSVVAAAVGFRLLSSGPQSAPAASVLPARDALVLPAPGNATAAAVSITWPTAVARDPFSSELVFPPPAPPPQQPPPKAEMPVVVVPPAPPPVDLRALAHQTIHLKGTVLGERPLAMMNGRVYRVGEVIEGFKVVEIVTNQITVERDGLRIVVQAN